MFTYRIANKNLTNGTQIDHVHNKAIATIFFNIIVAGIGFFVLRRWVVAILVTTCFLVLELKLIEFPYQTIVMLVVFLVIILVCYRLANPSGGLLIPLIVFMVYSVQELGGPHLWKLIIPDVEFGNAQTNSMYPTIHEGDILITKKIDTSSMFRCQFVTFTHFINDRPVENITKRVVGLESDTIRIVDGSLLVNGKKLRCTGASIYYYNHGLLESSEDDYVVPKESVFVLGDNSQNSHDSRSFGAVEINKIVASPIKIIWPLNRAKVLYSYPIN